MKATHDDIEDVQDMALEFPPHTDEFAGDLEDILNRLYDRGYAHAAEDQAKKMLLALGETPDISLFDFLYAYAGGQEEVTAVTPGA